MEARQHFAILKISFANRATVVHLSCIYMFLSRTWRPTPGLANLGNETLIPKRTDESEEACLVAFAFCHRVFLRRAPRIARAAISTNP